MLPITASYSPPHSNTYPQPPPQISVTHIQVDADSPALSADALGKAGTQEGHLESQAVNQWVSARLAGTFGNGDLLGGVASVRDPVFPPRQIGRARRGSWRQKWDRSKGQELTSGMSVVHVCPCQEAERHRCCVAATPDFCLPFIAQ